MFRSAIHIFERDTRISAQNLMFFARFLSMVTCVTEHHMYTIFQNVIRVYNDALP